MEPDMIAVFDLLLCLKIIPSRKIESNYKDSELKTIQEGMSIYY